MSFSRRILLHRGSFGTNLLDEILILTNQCSLYLKIEASPDICWRNAAVPLNTNIYFIKGPLSVLLYFAGPQYEEWVFYFSCPVVLETLNAVKY
jgi:hypothetical protein